MATRKLRLPDWLASRFAKGTRLGYHSGLHDQDNRQHRYLDCPMGVVVRTRCECADRRPLTVCWYCWMRGR